MLRWIAAPIAALLGLAIAAALAIPYVVDTPRVQALISHSAAQALGRPVRFAALSVRVLPLPAVRLRDLEVAEDPRFGTKPFLSIETGSFRLRLLPLLRGRVEFGELVLERPQVRLIQDRTGRLNVATLGTAPGTAPPSRSGTGRSGSGGGALLVVSRIRIVDGALSYTSGAGAAAPTYRLGDLNLKLAGIGSTSPIEFSGQARLAPGELALTIADGRLAAAAGRSPLEAPLSARVALEARSLAGLAGAATGGSPELGGSLRGTFTVSGTLGSPRVTGEADVTPLTATQVRAACPEPRRRTLRLDLVRLPVTFADDVLTSQPLTTKLGPGAVTAGVRWSSRDALLRVSDLSIRALPLAPVLVDYLCQGYAVTGALDLTGEASARPSALWATLSGSGHLRIGPGKVVGSQALKLLGTVMRVGGAVVSLLNIDLPASLFSSPLDFDSITGSYTIRDGVVTTTDLRYASRAMQISAAGRYGLTDGRVNVDLVVTTGRAQIGATVVGSAASPSIRVKPGALLPARGGPRDLEEGVRDLLKRLK